MTYKPQVKFDEAATKLGWTLLFRGWPDRLVIDRDGNAFTVEVKAPLEPITSYQREMFTILELMGVRVFITSGDPQQLIPWKEWKVAEGKRGKPLTYNSFMSYRWKERGE
jgi:hypothetical protein